MPHIDFALLAIGISVVCFAAMLLALELGRRLGVRQQQKLGQASRAGVGTIDSAVYSLLALLAGFAFSGATMRFDRSRDLVTQEIDKIETAWRRLDALPAETQPVVRDAIRRYVDALLEAYAAPHGTDAESTARRALAREGHIVWTVATTASLTESGERARMLVLPALNDMFGSVEREWLSRQIHPPVSILLLLSLTAIAAGLFGGYAIASGTTRNWLHMVGVAATIAIVAYIILELEYPRRGLIRADSIDRHLVALRHSMGD
jgi:hypothetical protein